MDGYIRYTAVKLKNVSVVSPANNIDRGRITFNSSGRVKLSDIKYSNHEVLLF